MIALTGASGFVGGALLERLQPGQVVTVGRTNVVDGDQHGHVSIDLSNGDAAALTDALRPYQIDCIVHAAAITPWAKDADFSLDLRMAETLATVANELEVPRLLFMSGWVVYDPQAAVPYTEATPCNPSTPYGESKLAVERYFTEHLKNTQCVSVRAASIYGPGQRSSGLIPNLVGKALRGEALQLNARTTKRDYVYIGDVAHALLQLADMNLPPNLDVLNIGSGGSLTVTAVAEMIQSAAHKLGRVAEIGYTPQLTEGVPADNQLAIGRAQGLGLLKSQMSFGDGIQAYAEWMEHESIL